VNSLVFIGDKPLANIIIDDIGSNNQVEYRFITKQEYSTPLFLLENPRFYSQNNQNGIEYRKLALIHGDRVMATTINQRCHYWRTGHQCQFCAIELSLDAGNTTEKKTASELIDWIRIAKSENLELCSHITLTIGTSATADKGAAEYIAVIQDLKAVYPEIPIHIQIEPMKDKTWYDKVYEAGADTIGIHLEILDDEIRKRICPGKFSLTKTLYSDHWKYALSVFGADQVSSFILVGFEENKERLKEELTAVIKIGVIPIITPVRSIPSLKKELAKISAENFYDLTIFAAKKMLQHNVNPLKNKAGCVKCEGCSAIIDGYRLVCVDRE
jgi:radical SAM protein (TIGR04043 family)